MKLVAAAWGGKIYTSTDAGVSWDSRTSERIWRSVASSADGARLVGVVSGGRIYTSEAKLTPTPGPAGFLGGGQHSAIELLYSGHGQFIPLSFTGTLNVE